MIVELSQGDLNPCYSCGATEQDDDVHVCYVDRAGVAGYIVQCDKCGAMSSALYQERKFAVDDWNMQKFIRVAHVGNLIAHYGLNDYAGFSFDGESCSVVHQAAVKSANMLDTAVVNEVLKIAKEDPERKRKDGKIVKTKERRTPEAWKRRRARERQKMAARWMREDADRRLLPKFQGAR